MPFKIGDIIFIDNLVVKVTEVSKQVYGTDLKFDKKISIGYKRKDIKVLTPVPTNVVKDYPHIEVMHPETYEPVRVENTKKNVKAGDDVKIVILEENGKI